MKGALDALDPVPRLRWGNEGLLVEGWAPDLGKLLRECCQGVQNAGVDIDATGPDRVGKNWSGSWVFR